MSSSRFVNTDTPTSCCNQIYYYKATSRRFYLPWNGLLLREVSTGETQNPLRRHRSHFRLLFLLNRNHRCCPKCDSLTWTGKECQKKAGSASKVSWFDSRLVWRDFQLLRDIYMKRKISYTGYNINQEKNYYVLSSKVHSSTQKISNNWHLHKEYHFISLSQWVEIKGLFMNSKISSLKCNIC